jgi:dolichol-phosphate mannosyltransferase
VTNDKRSTSAVVIIPTYNEVGNLAELTRRLLSVELDFDVLFVDDGSPDGTGRLADELAQKYGNVSVIHRERKLGYGSAVIEGFRAALKKEYAWILLMDADLSHDPASIPALLKAAENSDLVLGSRYIGGVRVVDWEVMRVLLSCFANRYAHAITGLPVDDVTTGFRCYRASFLRKLDLSRIKANGYGFQIEMAYWVWKLGGRLSETPIIFYGRQQGKSKISRQMIFEAAFLVWRLRLSSIFDRKFPNR